MEWLEESNLVILLVNWIPTDVDFKSGLCYSARNMVPPWPYLPYYQKQATDELSNRCEFNPKAEEVDTVCHTLSDRILLATLETYKL